MNSIFDFTGRQVKFVAFLSIILVILSGYIFIRSNIIATEPPSKFEIFIGEDEQVYTGIFILDPNTAPADSLELLPGIGRVLSDRIVAYRETHRFESAIDITEVKGIGPKLYERLKPYLKVERK